MGQRHQAFLIAKVKPHGSTTAQYRCIAAYHHQWCYGSLPLQAARRCMALVRQPQNAAVVREELRSIDGRYGPCAEKPRIPQVPCPFSAALLAHSWDADFAQETVYVTGVSVQNNMLHAGMSSWGGDNNDGITVIDVTNPEDPAYCFLLRPGKPQTAEDYLGHYYDLSGSSADEDDDGAEHDTSALILGALSNALAGVALQSGNGGDVADEDIPEPGAVADEDIPEPGAVFDDLPDDNEDAVPEAAEKKTGVAWYHRFVEDLKDERVVEYSALRQAWPDEYPELPSGEPDEQPTVAAEDAAGVPSLVDISLRKAIDQGIESGDVSAIDELVWLPSKAHIVEECLLGLSPFPDAALPLLSRLAKDNKYHDSLLDLSGYPLSGEQVATVAEGFDGLYSLNLSRNSVINAEGVRALHTKVSSLKRLVLMNCPAFPNADMKTLLRTSPDLFRGLHALVHPYLLELYFPRSKKAAKPPPAHMSVLIRTQMHPSIAGVSYPFLSPALLVQGLTDLVAASARSKDAFERFPWMMSAARAVEVAFSALPRPPGAPWGTRTIAPGMPLDLGAFAGTAPGWLLLLRPMNVYAAAPAAGYAFLRVLGAADAAVEGEAAADKCRVKYELYDLRGFLAETEKEGCPAVSAEMVKAVEDVLEEKKAFWPVLTRAQANQLLSSSAMWHFQFN